MTELSQMASGAVLAGEHGSDLGRARRAAHDLFAVLPRVGRAVISERLFDAVGAAVVGGLAGSFSRFGRGSIRTGRHSHVASATTTTASATAAGATASPPAEDSHVGRGIGPPDLRRRPPAGDRETERGGREFDAVHPHLGPAVVGCRRHVRGGGA